LHQQEAIKVLKKEQGAQSLGGKKRKTGGRDTPPNASCAMRQSDEKES